MSQFPVIPGANTDVEEFVTDLEGGAFAIRLSVAVSQVAAAVVDRDPTPGASMTTESGANGAGVR